MALPYPQVSNYELYGSYGYDFLFFYIFSADVKYIGCTLL